MPADIHGSPYTGSNVGAPASLLQKMKPMDWTAFAQSYAAATGQKVPRDIAIAMGLAKENRGRWVLKVAPFLSGFTLGFGTLPSAISSGIGRFVATTTLGLVSRAVSAQIPGAAGTFLTGLGWGGLTRSLVDLASKLQGIKRAVDYFTSPTRMVETFRGPTDWGMHTQSLDPWINVERRLWGRVTGWGGGAYGMVR